MTSAQVIVVFVVVVLYLWRRRRYHYADTESAKEMETSRLTDLTALQSGNYKVLSRPFPAFLPVCTALLCSSNRSRSTTRTCG